VDVGADDEEQLAVVARQLLEGVDGVRRTAAIDLDTAGLDPGDVGDRRGDHCESILGGCHLSVGFLPRLVGDDEQNFVEVERVTRF
jgi:hypothetical protein